MSELKRYPGPKPFAESEADIFKGRAAAITKLHCLVRQENLVILHAKSGVGKSSLISAGLLPEIRKNDIFTPVEVRFEADGSDGANTPLETTIASVRKGIKNPESGRFIDKVLQDDNSLWRAVKELELDSSSGNSDAGNTSILLIFDQFEELFSYHPAQGVEFRSQLAEVINSRLPQRYWDMLNFYGDDNPLDVEERRLLQRPVRVHILIAIREDRMHQLGKMADHLSIRSKNWFELAALSYQDATTAIVEPAAASGNFQVAPFVYDEQAITAIIEYLSGSTGEVESPQLQLICDAVERRMEKKTDRTVTLEVLGKLEDITEQFYLDKLAEIDNPEEQAAARHLIEEELIFEPAERRLTRFSGQINLQAETLKTLVDGYLLRRLTDVKGGYNYELSHDTLVKPILGFKRERLGKLAEEKRKQEEAAREQQRQEEKAAQEEALRQEKAAADKAKQQNRRLRLLLGLALLAIGAAAFLGFQVFEAKKVLSEIEINDRKLKEQDEELAQARAEFDLMADSLAILTSKAQAATLQLRLGEKEDLIKEAESLRRSGSIMRDEVQKRVDKAKALAIEGFEERLKKLEQWLSQD